MDLCTGGIPLAWPVGIKQKPAVQHPLRDIAVHEAAGAQGGA